jgi:hypothetical protein
MKTEEPRAPLEQRRADAARAWTALQGALRSELGWRPSRRSARLLAAGAVGVALGWAWRRRRR